MSHSKVPLSDIQSRWPTTATAFWWMFLSYTGARNEWWGVFYVLAAIVWAAWIYECITIRLVDVMSNARTKD